MSQAVHKAHECSRRKFPCVFCQLQVSESEKQAHEDFCGARSVECELCSAPVPRRRKNRLRDNDILHFVCECYWYLVGLRFNFGVYALMHPSIQNASWSFDVANVQRWRCIARCSMASTRAWTHRVIVVVLVNWRWVTQLGPTPTPRCRRWDKMPSKVRNSIESTPTFSSILSASVCENCVVIRWNER